MKRVLVTGAAGFIGFHTSLKLLEQGYKVFGLDNFSDYYDVNLKRARVAQLVSNPRFELYEKDLADALFLKDLFKSSAIDLVVHLAAQAGVRYSLTNPQVYIDSNVTGTLNLLEAARAYPVEHFVFASTSSVYGLHKNMPFSAHDGVDHPVSLYAATKKSCELMAHSYAHLFRIPVTGLRFFTVYGPWGRPDMALFLFTKAILESKPIDVFNEGKLRRDFTYVDDIVEGIVRILKIPPSSNPSWDPVHPDPGTSSAPYRIFNIGNNQPVELLDFIEAIENSLGIKSKRNLMPMQQGDVTETFADVKDLMQITGFSPKTSIQVGIDRFVKWYRSYYNV